MSPNPKKCKLQKSPEKCLLNVFSDEQGLIFVKCFQKKKKKKYNTFETKVEIFCKFKARI